VENSLGHDKSFLRTKLNGSTLQIEDQQAFQHKEEFIINIVLVPVMFAVPDAETDDGVIDPAKSLVTPIHLACVDHGRNVNRCKRWKSDRWIGGVEVCVAVCHCVFTYEDVLLKLSISCKPAAGKATCGISRACSNEQPLPHHLAIFRETFTQAFKTARFNHPA
jgi:hypothetical protein